MSRAAQAGSMVALLAAVACAASFDVASVKRSAPDHVGAQMYSPGPGRFTAMTATARNLIAYAYGVPDFRVQGGPAWASSEAYDITAKAAERATRDEIKLMLQDLLVSRFQLAAHRETREVAVYRLVVAKGGPKLQAVDQAGRGVGFGRGLLNGAGADMKTLASVLTGQLGRSVTDQTGVQGFYNFKLVWTPEEASGDEPSTSLFAALQEQLGLKLESARGPVEMIVVDRLERPTEN